MSDLTSEEREEIRDWCRGLPGGVCGLVNRLLNDYEALRLKKSGENLNVAARLKIRLRCWLGRHIGGVRGLHDS